MARSFKAEVQDIRDAIWIRKEQTGDEFLDGIVMRLDAAIYAEALKLAAAEGDRLGPGPGREIASERGS